MYPLHRLAQGLRVAGVGNHVVGARQARLARGLGGEDGVRLGRRAVVARHQALALQGLGGIDQEHPVLAPVAVALHQQGDHQQQVGALGLCREFAHARVDGRVHQGLQVAALSRIREHPAAQGAPVQAAVGGEDVGAEASCQRLQQRLARLHQLARHQVGVDHRYPQGGEVVGGGALAAGDAAGERHPQHAQAKPASCR